MFCTYFVRFACVNNTRQTFRSHLVNLRQIHALRYGVSKCVNDGATNNVGRLQCMATKVKMKSRPRPRPRTEDQEAQKGGGLRRFFIVTLPSLTLGFVVLIVIVFAIGMMKSVKENASTFYKGTHLGLYRLAFDKCSNNNKVVEALGSPISELIDKQDKVKVSRTIKDKEQHYTMEFKIKGSQKDGVVSLEASKKQEEDFQIVYIMVKSDSKQIIVEDNR